MLLEKWFCLQIPEGIDLVKSGTFTEDVRGKCLFLNQSAQNRAAGEVVEADLIAIGHLGRYVKSEGDNRGY